MSEPPRRPILKLKSPPPAILRPEPLAPAPAKMEVHTFGPRRARAPTPPPAPPPPSYPWKCRPCGAGFEVAEELVDEDWVRCPKCNARLGRAGDFRAEPPRLEKLRARAAKRGD
jgi:hypothetical protein